MGELKRRVEAAREVMAGIEGDQAYGRACAYEQVLAWIAELEAK